MTKPGVLSIMQEKSEKTTLSEDFLLIGYSTIMASENWTIYASIVLVKLSKKLQKSKIPLTIKENMGLIPFTLKNYLKLWYMYYLKWSVCIYYLQLENGTEWAKKKQCKELKEALKDGNVPAEHRVYFSLPANSDHRGHLTEEVCKCLLIRETNINYIKNNMVLVLLCTQPIIYGGEHQTVLGQYVW